MSSKLLFLSYVIFYPFLSLFLYIKQKTELESAGSRLFLLTFTILFLFSINTHCADIGNRIIGREEIEASGITQLSEIFTLIPEWTVSSVDGVSWDVSPLGIESYAFQRWKILLDSVVLNLDILGAKTLDMIPINISQIDHIEIINIPGFYSGEYIESGGLHIHTFKPVKNTSLNIEGNLANETGDPGPYRYTKYKSQNVDRLAENIGVSLSKKFGNSYLSTSFKNSVHFPTDPAVYERNINEANGDYPKQVLYALGLNFKINQLKIESGISTFKDFHNLTYYDRTIAFNKSCDFINISHCVYLFKSIDIFTQFRVDRITVKDHLNRFSIYKEENFTPAVIIRLKKQKYNLSIKSEYRVQEINSKTNLTRDFHQTYNIDIFKTSSEFTYSVSNKVINYISTEYFQYNSKNNNFIFNEKLQYHFNQHNKLAIGFYWGRRFSEEINYIFIMSSTDKTYLVPNIIYFENQIYQFYLSVSFDLNDKISCHITSFYSYYDNYPISTKFYSDFGRIFSNQVRLKYKVKENFETDLFYSFTDESQSLEDSRNYYPSHTLQLHFIYTPAKSLSLWGRVKYTSSSTWFMYRDAELDNMWIVDMTINKKLMNNRASFVLGMRNILNDTQRYHPMGAAFDLNYFVRFSIDLI